MQGVGRLRSSPICDFEWQLRVAEFRAVEVACGPRPPVQHRQQLSLAGRQEQAWTGYRPDRLSDRFGMHCGQSPKGTQDGRFGQSPPLSSQILGDGTQSQAAAPLAARFGHRPVNPRSGAMRAASG